MPRTYLFALTDGGGTVPPEVGAVRRLVERGHRVRVLAEDSMAPEVHATDATLVPWATAPNRPDRDPADDPLQDWAAPSLLAQARDMGDHLIAGPAPDYARDVLAMVGPFRTLFEVVHGPSPAGWRVTTGTAPASRSRWHHDPSDALGRPRRRGIAAPTAGGKGRPRRGRRGGAVVEPGRDQVVPPGVVHGSPGGGSGYPA
ncbi:hypothetical protein H1Q78_15425 [Cellulosimicrobium cellulans]|uniref:hypothetical protein n=1 Tax=Cellulosimicrobium cellulans TaxID=1710 RepID=UPI001EDC1CA7|nr:hypothetical protein [Cellulosimicrobium cellulans]UKJ63074.1 hypothetical protein H1Q78_15425 [Cellulosimicrobium cellulans]